MTKAMVDYQDFAKLDIRVGVIQEVSLPDWSRKLIRLVVDFGEDIGTRVILAGVRQWYQPDDFMGRKGIFLVNLTPKKMGEDESCGMMLMSDSTDQPRPLWADAQTRAGDSIA